MSHGERGITMEGRLAQSYACHTQKSMPEFVELADRIANWLPADAEVLEIAPGPGFLACELARRGFRVTGIDISKSFVEIGKRNARNALVDVEFIQGNASAMPFEDGRFDYVVCRAAFKNFSDPLGALAEIRRVLKPGGSGLIIDLRRDVSMSGIIRAIYPASRYSFWERLQGRFIFWMLRRRAYTIAEMQALLRETGFDDFNVTRVDEAAGFAATFYVGVTAGSRRSPLEV